MSGVMPGYQLLCVYPTYLSVLPFLDHVPDTEHQSKIEDGELRIGVRRQNSGEHRCSTTRVESLRTC